MSAGLQLRWVQDDERDRIAVVRMRAYAAAAKELPTYQERIRLDSRATAGDFLLAETGGEAVGTATSLSFQMWLRGGPVPCQGIAYVGTVRTHRRGGSGDSPGIATQIMKECLRKARERQQAISALIPFRNSFYDHFGYGLVERRHDWTVPIGILPKGDFDGLRYYRSEDLADLAACRQRIVCSGQADIKRTRQAWEYFLRRGEDGFFVVDRPDEQGPVRGYCGFAETQHDGERAVRVNELGFEDPAALVRILRMLASLKDQYASAILSLPADFPLNRLLRESQIPHKQVVHATAECRPYTRMQVKILDHAVVLGAMTKLPEDRRGKVIVEISESEGTKSRLSIEIANGRATATPTEATAQFECRDTTWASVVFGEITASRAVELGLATSAYSSATALLDAFAVGPLPFCNEPF
jgi:predicted acetyltransferase